MYNQTPPTKTQPHRGGTPVAAGANPRTATQCLHESPVGGAMHKTQSPTPNIKKCFPAAPHGIEIISRLKQKKHLWDQLWHLFERSAASESARAPKCFFCGRGNHFTALIFLVTFCIKAKSDKPRNLQTTLTNPSNTPTKHQHFPTKSAHNPLTISKNV